MTESESVALPLGDAALYYWSASVAFCSGQTTVYHMKFNLSTLFSKFFCFFLENNENNCWNQDLRRNNDQIPIKFIRKNHKSRKSNRNDCNENNSIPNPIASTVINLLYEGVKNKNESNHNQRCFLWLGEQSCQNNAIDYQPKAGKKMYQPFEVDVWLILRSDTPIIFLFRCSVMFFHVYTAFRD